MSTSMEVIIIAAERIALNWSVFRNSATGAARRAYELHRRMPEDLEFVAFVTADMSKEWRNEFKGFTFV